MLEGMIPQRAQRHRFRQLKGQSPGAEEMKVDKITFGAGEDVVKSMTLISSADMDLTAYVVGMGCSEATFQLESIGGNVKYNDILRRDVLLEKDEVKDESMRNMPLELRAVFGPAAALMEETTLLHAFRDLIRNS